MFGVRSWTVETEIPCQTEVELAGSQLSLHGEHQFGLGVDEAVDANGCVAVPARSSEQIRTAAVAGRAAAEVVEIVGVAVDELDRVITARLDASLATSRAWAP